MCPFSGQAAASEVPVLDWVAGFSSSVDFMQLPEQ